MTPSLARLRKRAAEFEQKRQFDKALEVYIQILDDGGKDLGDEDVPLFNRVGDMLMRKGNVTEALGYYERAVDLYAERGFLNNAIALCSKILRQSPGRAAVYYKLGRISARKGFKSDARKNFLEYADRMQKAGQSEEAFRALKEFASLYPDQDDVRLTLAELLSKENRKGEALEQLQELYRKLESEGRRAEARATIDRMRAIDPSATPREGLVPPVATAGDLVFLDLTDEVARPVPRTLPATEAQPISARAPEVTHVSALSGLAITFLPDESEPAHPEGFEATAAAEAPPSAEMDLATAAPEELEPPGADHDWDAVDPDAVSVENAPREPVELGTLGEPADREPEPVALLDDFEPTSNGPITTESEEVASSSQHGVLSGSEFADLDLEDLPRSAVIREHDLVLPGDLPVTPDPPVAIVRPLLDSEAAAEDARAAAEEAADLEADIAARAALQYAASPAIVEGNQPTSDVAGSELADDDESEAGDEEANEEPEDEDEGVYFGAADVEGAGDALLPVELPPDLRVPDDFLTTPPGFGDTGEAEDHAFPPLFGLEDPALTNGATAPTPGPFGNEDESAAAPPTGSTVSIGGAEGHLRQRLEFEPENWELRRMLGEALLDSGDRDGGLYEMELAMVGFELDGDIERAQEVIDEILAVQPASVRHHQKRVEYAVRSRDHRRLTSAYLELADALFRTGVGDKAVAVYRRVLELDAENERAEFALVTLAPDVLAKLRGAPVSPGRWSDELAAIDGPVRYATPAAQEVAGPAGLDSADLPPAAVVVKPDAEPRREEPGAHDLVREPHEPEAGEAAAELDASDVEAVSEAASDAMEPRGESVGLPEELPVQVGGSEPSPVAGEVLAAAFAAEVADEVDALEPSEAEAQGTAEEVQAGGGRNGNPPAAADGPADGRSRLDRVRSLTPAAASESDFVDLGEWLRTTEPVRSTRMLVEDPRPTGDEQADFEELLRRFKRGVAENVEAEDYEAHYDLGVAYKEMGLVDEAIAQFQKALRGSSHRVRSYEALGQCFVEKAQYPIAAALLQRATELPGSDDQQLVGVLYLLGFAMEHMGRPAEALPYYLRVFAVDIEFRDIAQRVAAMGNATT